jgi:hypothetical protein
MSKIHIIYEPDAQPVVPALEDVLGELKRSKNISDFNRLQDFSNLTQTIGSDDIILILLSNSIEEKLEHVLSVFENLRHRKPSLQVIGLKVDELTGTFPFFFAPHRFTSHQGTAFPFTLEGY